MSGTRVLVSRPIAVPLSVSGRGTRTYWAMRTLSDGTTDIVLLKDTWRYAGQYAEKEGCVIAELNEKAVKNVPKVLYHQDVPQVHIEEESIDLSVMTYAGEDGEYLRLVKNAARGLPILVD